MDNELELRFKANVTTKSIRNYFHTLLFYNVLTLYESKKAGNDGVGLVLGRRALLDEQFVQFGASIIGLAETRTRSRKFCTDSFIVVSSGLQKNSLGMEIWLARKFLIRAINKSIKSVSLSARQVSVTYASPRILLVAAVCNDSIINVLAYHAPHEQWEYEVRKEFFEELKRVSSLPTKGCLYTLGDANGTVGECPPKHIGQHEAETQSSNGNFLHDFLKLTNTFIPNTFYVSSNGNPVKTFKGIKRIDYISIPLSIPYEACSAGSCTALSALAPEDDHAPTFVKLEVGSSDSVVWTQRKKQRYDTSVALDSGSFAFLKRDLAQPYLDSVPSSSNHAICSFSNHIHNVLPSFYPKPTNKFKAHQFISDNTRQIVRSRDRQIGRVRAFKAEYQIHTIFESASAFSLVRELRRLNKCVVSAVASDKKDWFDGLARQIVEHDRMHLHKFAYQTMRQLQHKPIKPCSAIVDASGNVITNPIEIRSNFQRHLATLNRGEVVPFSKLLSVYHSSKLPFTDHESELASAYIPSVPLLASFCAAVKRDKANGEDEFPGNVYIDCPREFAVALHPVVTKTILTFQEPLTWLGGVAHEIQKTAGSTAAAKNHRFVLLADIAGKVYHSYLRSCLLGYPNSYILHTMCGGFLRRGADFASIYLFNFVECARRAKLFWALLFLDVSAAFESLQYVFVFEDHLSDQVVCSIFSKCNFSHSVFHQFVKVINNDTAFIDAGVPRILSKLVQSAHALSWFSCEGLDTYVVARQGSKAGDPLGDILFAFLITRVLRQYRAELVCIGFDALVDLSSEDGLFGPASSSSVDLSSINYVDDNVFPVMAEDSNILYDKLALISSAVLDLFASYLLKCALAANKTSILLGLSGKHKNQVYSRFNIVNKLPNLLINTKSLGECLIPVVKTYKHVGFVQNGQMANNLDISSRVNISKQSLKELGNPVLANTVLEFKTRMKFSLIPKAQMLSNSHLWHNITDSALAKLDTAYNNIHRYVCVAKYKSTSSKPPISTEALYRSHPIKNVLACIRARRLRQLARLINLAPVELKQLLAFNSTYEPSYASQLCKDLQWLYEFWTLQDACPVPPRRGVLICLFGSCSFQITLPRFTKSSKPVRSLKFIPCL